MLKACILHTEGVFNILYFVFLLMLKACILHTEGVFNILYFC